MSIDWLRSCRMPPAIRNLATRRTLTDERGSYPCPITITLIAPGKRKLSKPSRLKLTRFGCATQRVRTNRSKSEADTSAVLTIGCVAIT